MNAIFPVIALTAATFGGVVGWFSRGRFRPTILICTITPILAQAVILGLMPHEGFVKDEFAKFYYQIIFPFLLLTAPCVMGGVLISLVAYHMKHPHGKAGTQAASQQYPVSEGGLIQPWKRR